MTYCEPFTPGGTIWLYMDCIYQMGNVIRGIKYNLCRFGLIENNILTIQSDIGEIKEELPLSYITRDSQYETVDVKYSLEDNVVGFSFPYNNEEKLIGDGVVIRETV